MFEKIKELIASSHIESKASKKSNNTIALEVLLGKWGSGKTRKQKLTKAGYNYNTIQKIVNERMTKKSINIVAKEVIDGKWSKGDTRKKCLEVAGYNYNTVQKKVKEISDGSKTTEKKGYTGKFPTYKLTKTNAQVIADAVEWAKKIAKNNDFHYGYGSHSHHNGCYYCGTQKLKKGHGIKEWETTYCCNPFVGAAWAHGGGDATAYKMCRDCNSWDFGTGSGSYDKSKLFDKVSTKSLKVGDVLCSDSHVALYAGDGKVIQAGHEDDNKVNSKSWNGSISISTWNGYKRAYRYNGKVSVDRPLTKGELSDRVGDLQKYLKWYGYNISDTRFFNTDTFNAVVEFQEKEMGKGQGDGIVGEKTIEAMKKVKK